MHKKHSIENLNFKIQEEKKKKTRKGKLKNEEESQSEQSSSKTQWKELSIPESKTGLNPVKNKKTDNSGLEKNIGQAMEEWNIEKTGTQQLANYPRAWCKDRPKHTQHLSLIHI